MMESTSSLRPLPTSQATVAWPASWVAMVRRSASVYSTGWARPISSVILAFWMSSQSSRSAPRRRAHTSASSSRCSIITGEYPNGDGGQRVAPCVGVELGVVGLAWPGSSR